MSKCLELKERLQTYKTAQHLRIMAGERRLYRTYSVIQYFDREWLDLSPALQAKPLIPSNVDANLGRPLAQPMNLSESERGTDDVALPSMQALEAAAILRLVEMLRDSKTKPSEKAVLIAARMMARRAQRELHAKQSASGAGLPKF